MWLHTSPGSEFEAIDTVLLLHVLEYLEEKFGYSNINYLLNNYKI